MSFYQGAYGPTLRVSLRSEAQLEELSKIFESLAERRILEAQLERVMLVTYDGVRRVTLASDDTSDGRPKSLTMSAGREGRSFLWCQGSRGWDHCKGLLDGFSNMPGHQYLSVEGTDDALVEVSFVEDP